MTVRRFSGLTTSFLKKIENYTDVLALCFMHYNFARPGKTLSYPYVKTPAKAAGGSDHIWSLKEIVDPAGS